MRQEFAVVQAKLPLTYHNFEGQASQVTNAAQLFLSSFN
jgi:hypothetical protein